jgi:hypothetical protein
MMTKTLTSLAALVVIAACSRPGRLVEREPPFTRGPIAEETLRIHVQNDNFMDARLHAIGLGGRHMLGVVGGKQQAVLAIPWDFGGPLRIEINLLVGPTCTTRAIDADPGDTFDVRIEPVFSASAACS